MPTSSTYNSARKCKECRKNFTDIWLPNKICCRKERLNMEITDDFFRRTAIKPLNGSSEIRTLESFVTHNTGSPFCTLQKPTCGSNFSPDTNHKKQKQGVQPADIPKWQNKNQDLQQNLPIVRPIGAKIKKVQVT